MIDIGDDAQRVSIIAQSSAALDQRLQGELSAYELRTAGFLANKLSQWSLNAISQYAARVYAQAVATGHMRGHAIVSADYAIKVINLQQPNNEAAVIQEREKQLELAKHLAAK